VLIVVPAPRRRHSGARSGRCEQLRVTLPSTLGSGQVWACAAGSALGGVRKRMRPGGSTKAMRFRARFACAALDPWQRRRGARWCGVLVRSATTVTTPTEEPKLRSVRADFGHVATQEVRHLVNGCAATNTLPQIVQVHRGFPLFRRAGEFAAKADELDGSSTRPSQPAWWSTAMPSQFMDR